MAKEPRDYQVEAREAFFDYFNNGGTGNPLLVIPQRLGKSLTMADIIKHAHKQFPFTKFMCLASDSVLLEQNRDELMEHWPFVSTSMYCAKLKSKRTHGDVQFASIQSIANKIDDLHHLPDLVFIDEGQNVSDNDTTQYRQFCAELLRRKPTIKICGFTGTPFRADSGYLHHGERRLFTDIIYNFPVERAIKEGYWCPPVTPQGLTQIDVSNVPMQNGDFVEKKLAEAIDVDAVTKQCVKEIVTHGRNRKAWVIYTAGTEHCLHVRDEIRSYGIHAEMMHSKMPKDEQADIFARFKAGEIRCLAVVSMLCLDSETEILTDSGWVGMNEMSYNHKVASWYKDGSITFDKPKLVIRRPLDDEDIMVSVDSRFHNIRVTGNHRMLHMVDGSWNDCDAESLVGKEARLPTSGIARPSDVCMDKHQVKYKCSKAKRIAPLKCLYKKKYNLNNSKAREMAENYIDRKDGKKPLSPSELSIAQCHLIGFWLGDGTGVPFKKQISLTQSMVYGEIVNWVDGVLSDSNISSSRMHRKSHNKNVSDYVTWVLNSGMGGVGQEVENGYYSIAPYLNKNGCDLYWGLTTEQFDALMYGFWMADGNHGDGKTKSSNGTSICGTQRKLYDLLQAIGTCRGYRVTVTKQAPPPKSNWSQQWRMSWRKKSTIDIYKDKLRVVDRVDGETVWCVTSKSSYIITRRKGKVCVMGNTTGFNHPPLDLVALMRPTRSPVLYAQSAARGCTAIYADGYDTSTVEGRLAAIAASEKPDTLVLDFGGCIDALGPLDGIYVESKPESSGGGEAPTKVCPACFEIIHAATNPCPECGYEFEKEIHITRTASNEYIVGALKEPEWLVVMHVQYKEHKNAKGEKSVLCKYICGTKQVWVWRFFRFKHTESIDWWDRASGGTPPPKSTEEALQRIEELKSPSMILTEKKGKYDKILDYRYDFINGL